MDSASRSIGVRSGFAVLLWLSAVTAPALLILGSSAPETAVSFATTARGVIGQVVMIGTLVIVVALLAYPPFVPAVRVLWRRLKGRMSVDQAPLLNALGRLEHLETGPDHLIVARTRLQMGDVNRALPHLVRAVELEPDQLDSRALLGHTCLQLGALEPALQHLAIVVERDASHGFGTSLADLGRTLDRAGRDDEALQVFEKFESQFGPNRELDVLRAGVARRKGDIATAGSLLERAARPLEGTENANPEAALWRARARVRLWRTSRVS